MFTEIAIIGGYYVHNEIAKDVAVISLVNNSLSLIIKDIPQLPEGLWGLQGTKTPYGDILLCGGGDGLESKCNEYYRLKNGSDQWKKIGTLQTKRMFHASVFIDGCLFTSGGTKKNLPFLNHEGFSFDRGVNEKKDMPISLYGHTATIFGPTKILICGGCNDVCDDLCGGCNVVNECGKNVRKAICKS